ncbi:MAG TPA: hypothetical protein VGP38_12140 [Rubrobacter sp.]|nr:hypothetical protein [Rubrobacter sp.]
MTAGEDPQNVTGGPRLNPSSAPSRGAAMAAGLLEVVRTLARDLAGELQALSVPADAETGAVEGALRAADLANLAACVVPELTEARATEAAAAAYQAAGVARALCVLAEAGTAGTGGAGGGYALNALGDVRGAAWRARLAVRQMDEFFESEG